MTPEMQSQLEGHFLRVNLKLRAEYHNYSIPFISGWCKGCWDEGLFLVNDADPAKAGGPFVVPWENIAAIQVDAVGNAWDCQKEAETKFDPTEAAKAEAVTAVKA